VVAPSDDICGIRGDMGDGGGMGDGVGRVGGGMGDGVGRVGGGKCAIGDGGSRCMCVDGGGEFVLCENGGVDRMTGMDVGNCIVVVPPSGVAIVI
jgi:hypothetical protein